MEPKVSVVVPIYNVPEKFLRKCVESIIHQSLKEIEIILVNDGSKDDSGSICDEYALLDNRVKVIHKVNGGLSAARNTGVKVAKGNWITFVDGDDWIEPQACEQSMKRGLKENAQIVCWGSMKDYGSREDPYDYSDLFEDGKLYGKTECKYMQEMLLNANAHIATAYSKLIKKDFIDRYDTYHDEELRQGAEGLEFCIRLFDNAERILFINEHWYHYIYNPDSISARSTDQNNYYVLNCFESIHELVQKSSNKDRLLPWFYNRLTYVIITTAISGYFHPDNDESFSVKKSKLKEFLKNELIQTTLSVNNTKGIGIQRKIVLFLIKSELHIFLDILGKVRKVQKSLQPKLGFSIT